ncbi:MAG: FkbM family methyltransferase [Candidatus Magasanikbacteria bacterium]|nr:FkbM family methyltransferase [Candidatus Magasanikbacteria bacterium]
MFKKLLFKIFRPLISRSAVKKHKGFKFLRNFFGLVFVTSVTSVQGFKMKLHKTGHSLELAFEGCYEPLEVSLLKKINLKDKIVLDIGACLGYYSLLLSEVVGANGRVLAFEPEEKNYKMLCENIVLNKIKNVDCFNLAVGNKNTAVFLKRSFSPGQHCVARGKENTDGLEKIKMIRVDEFLVDQKKPSKDVAYIKIDVEGCEFEVLKGMKQLISSADDQLIIQFEYAPQHLRDYCKLEDLFSFIKEEKFFVYYWDLKLKKLLQVTDIEWFVKKEIIEMFRLGEVCSRNIILSKKELEFDFVIKNVEPIKIAEIADQDGKKFYKLSEFVNIQVPIETNLDLPKSGLFFVNALKDIEFKDKKVLDIGTGYFGYIAQHAKIFGAKEVVAIDIDKKAIEFSKKEYSKGGVEYLVSDIYSALNQKKKFDIIISNPPQLPSCSGGEVHDVAGKDGLEAVRRILNGFTLYINKDGKLYLLIFDFLLEKTQDICKKNKLNCRIVAYYLKNIRCGGEKEKNILKLSIQNIYFKNAAKVFFIVYLF